MKRYFIHTILLFLLVSVIGGCSTEKNTLASRTFHNVTSQYNVYFNANESLKSGVQEIEERINNDFTRILPIYKSSDPSTANMVKSDMDNAIIKSSKLIEVHSITQKPKRRKRRTRRYQEFASQEEFNKWVDDAYLLMGKAYFYQKNYFAAVDNFSYVVRKYPDEETKDEANIWLIRSYSEMERFAEASEVIQAIQNEEDFPKNLERELAVATADYYMKQNLYTEAIKFLDIAINKTLLKKNKTRLQYIIAQLYEELGMDENASSAYREVLKLNPDYNMAFNAKIKAAGVFAGTGDRDKLLKDLNKLLRDKKNDDFRDQIYFAIANLYYREGNRDLAIDNYKKSVATSFDNQYQRALSSITLADIYLEDLKYRNAQAYYDSAMVIIDENYPNYSALENKYKSLTSLVDQLMIVEREDSLQRVANMSDSQREALISQLIKEEQERLRNAENLALQGGNPNSSYYRNNRNRLGMSNQQSGAGWYFYNPQTVSYGRVTFRQIWGQRKNEDNWRRSNKASLSIDEASEIGEEAIDSSQMVVMVDDPLQKEYYTQYLPLTDSLMKVSHGKIRDALYNAGKIFKSEFNNYERSAETFKELVNRYPENMYLLSSYFDLYDLYELMGDNENANRYRNLIISEFPNSKYAQYLQNPNFFTEMEALTDSINNLYQDAFRNYKGGYYKGVITLAQQIKTMQPDSQMIPKIDFMSMVANGTQTNVHEFENLLENYIDTYPNEEPTPLANEILKLIQDSTLADYQKLVEMGYISEEIQNEELLAENLLADDEFGGKYSYDDDLLHYFVIAYPRDAKVDINRLKFDIANYNIDHYTKIDFDIETDNLDENTTFLIVRALENKEAALIYHGAVIRKATVFQALKDIDYYNFVISSTNYREVMAEKSIADYLKFFVKNYSRFIQSNFEDIENEISPEELMARAKAEDEVLQERGEFVVVNTGAEKYFNPRIDTLQNFVIAVKDKNLSLRQILNDFSEYNRDEYRIWNLALQLRQTDDYQLLVVSGIPTLNESMSYFRRVVVTRSLFEPLGQATYRNFLITNENLQKMVDQNKVDDYMDFFRTNYINRPSTNSTPSGTSSSVDTQETVPVTNDPVEETIQAAPEQIVEDEYTGPYNETIDAEQYFVFVIPTLDIDQPAFVNGIEQFNTANYANLDLNVEVQPLDDIRQIVLVSGLPNRETAQTYFTKVVNNRSLYDPLRDGNYRNFLITKDNYEIFLKEKNITVYMDFYKQFYLGQ